MAQTRHDIFGEVQMNTNEWQPIETAPKDNKKILLLVWEGEWRKPRQIREVRFGYNGRPINRYRTEEGEAYEVTHWMPLPEPPK